MKLAEFDMWFFSFLKLENEFEAKFQQKLIAVFYGYRVYTDIQHSYLQKV